MGGGSDQSQGQDGTSPFLTYLANPQAGNAPTWFNPSGPLISTYWQVPALKNLECDPTEVEKTKKGLAGDAEALEAHVDLPAVAAKAFGSSGLGQELDALTSQAHGHLRGALATLTDALHGYVKATQDAHGAISSSDDDSAQQFKTAVAKVDAASSAPLASTDDASQKAIQNAQKAQQQAAADAKNSNACTAPTAPTGGE